MCTQAYSGPPKLIVFGGRGFVGSAVCKEALNTGLHVVAISPSGVLYISEVLESLQVPLIGLVAISPLGVLKFKKK